MGSSGHYGSELLALGIEVDSRCAPIKPHGWYVARTNDLKAWLQGLAQGNEYAWTIEPAPAAALVFADDEGEVCVQVA